MGVEDRGGHDEDGLVGSQTHRIEGLVGLTRDMKLRRIAAKQRRLARIITDNWPTSVGPSGSGTANAKRAMRGVGVFGSERLGCIHAVMLRYTDHANHTAHHRAPKILLIVPHQPRDCRFAVSPAPTIPSSAALTRFL